MGSSGKRLLSGPNDGTARLSSRSNFTRYSSFALALDPSCRQRQGYRHVGTARLAFITANEMPQTRDVRASEGRSGTGLATAPAKAMIFSIEGDSLTSKRGVYFSWCCLPRSSNAVRNPSSLRMAGITVQPCWWSSSFFSSRKASHEALEVLDM